MSETTSTKGQPFNRDAEWHYEVDAPIRDAAAAAIGAARRQYEKDYPKADMDGLIWQAKKVPNQK